MTDGAGKVAAALRAAGCVRPLAEARLLLAAAQDGDHLAELLERRVHGVPLEHVVGWAEFCGLRVHLTDGVFVPRRRTSVLVEVTAGLVRQDALVVDLCCGSGAIGLALAHRAPGLRLWATDVDERAVACAWVNLEPLGAHVRLGDLWSALPAELAGTVDLAVANAPYVPTDDIELMPRDWREHEPRVALDGGADGLDLHRRILTEAAHWLAPEGMLLVEVSRAQSQALSGLISAAGLAARIERRRAGTAVVSATRTRATSSSGASSGSSSGR